MHQLWNCPTYFSWTGHVYLVRHPRAQRRQKGMSDVETFTSETRRLRCQWLDDDGALCPGLGQTRLQTAVWQTTKPRTGLVWLQLWEWAGAARQQALHPTIGTDHWTGAKRKNEQRCSSSSRIWCKMLINKHCPLWQKLNAATIWCRRVQLLQCHKSHTRPLHLCQGSDNTYDKTCFLSLFWFFRPWSDKVLRRESEQSGLCKTLVPIYVQKWCYAL